MFADVGIWVKGFGNARRQRINFNASDGRAPKRLLRHKADEVADAEGRFKNSSALKTKPLGGLIHGPNNHRGGVMGVEGGGAGGTMFFVG